MPNPSQQESEGTEPRGFGEHSRGLSGEYAHEQGWGLNLEQRKRQSAELQNADGGTDYEYGARDFGDEPVNTNAEPMSTGRTQNSTARIAKPRQGVSMANLHAKRQSSEAKTHGDKLESKNESAPKQSVPANFTIPAADNGGHARSQAAHLSGPAQDRSTASGNVRQPGQERQPPMEISRAGKDFRRQ